MMTANCTSFIPSIYNLSQQVLWALRITNSFIALLNIFGNSFLIYALKRTGQLTSTSLKLIVLMSASDCINGTVAFSLTNILLWKEYDSICYLKVVTQFIHLLFVAVSFGTILLIAIDRYFHMKYLERYPIIVTKRRGRFLCLLLLVFHILLTSASSMPLMKNYVKIGKLVYISCATLNMIAIIFFYYKTFKLINLRVLSMHNPAMQNSMTHSKKIMNLALSISICTVFTSTPYIIGSIILDIGSTYQGYSVVELAIFKWFVYLLSLANGVCSCVIFISQNSPIKQLLRGITGH